MVVADALATAVVAMTPSAAAPTQIILLRCKVRFLSDRNKFKLTDRISPPIGT